MMSENVTTDFDNLITDISLSTHSALFAMEISYTPPYVPSQDEECIETIVGWQKSKSGFDANAGYMVDVTETWGLYRDAEDVIVDRRDLLVEWDNGDTIEIGLDEGSISDGSEAVVSTEQALTLAKRVMHAVEALA